jgi:hypothetical protein
MLGVPRREKSRGVKDFAKGEIEPNAQRFSSWQRRKLEGREGPAGRGCLAATRRAGEGF